MCASVNRTGKPSPQLCATFLLRAAICGAVVASLCWESLAAGIFHSHESAKRDTPTSRGAKAAAGAVRHRRPVTIEDAIAMRRLADPAYVGGSSSTGRVALFSPDGTKFIVILRKGNVGNNTNEYSLLLWETDEIFRSPNPDRLLTLTSSSNRPAIRAVSWLEDNSTIFFLGEHPGEVQQLYRFDCGTRRLTLVTHSPTNVLSYGIGSQNDIAYTAEPLPPRANATAPYLGRPISTELITEVLMGHPDEQWSDHVRLVTARGESGGQSTTLSENVLMPFPFSDDHPAISPDRRYVLALANVEVIPASWRDYRDSRMQKWTRWKTTAGQYSMLRHYLLFDTETGEERVLLNAPVSLGGGASSEAAWLPDSQSVVITNTYLPLDEASPEEREARVAGPFVVEVHVGTGEVTKISSKELKFVKWDERTNELLFDEGRGTESTPASKRLQFHKNGSTWTSTSVERSHRDGPEIQLDEGLNQPPQISAHSGSRKSLLLDLNPQFQELDFGREELIRWKATDGHEVEGGLYLPVDYVPGKRYPLVIQTHGFHPDRFEIDGPYTSAFAAQPLAGRGIMVLQAEKPERSAVLDHLATEPEAAWRVSAYEGAIDYLDGRGLIDRSRVGIMGFSRTCWYVKYALTHSAFHYAAASVADGFDMGYFAYVSMANRAYPDNEMDQIMGASPVGEGLQTWFEHSPGFRIDRVPDSTPLRIVASYPLDVLAEWEWFAMMKRLGKPVDMVVFLDGVHELEKPWNRLISQGGNVDWFDFWLNGREDPAKADQYKRWRDLRALTKAQQGR